MEEHIKKVMIDIGLTIKDQMHPLVKSAYYLKARFALIEPPFVRAVEQARRIDQTLGEVLEEIHDLHSTYFRELIDIVLDLEPRTNKVQEKFKERNIKAYQEAGASNGAADKLFKENQELISSWEDERMNWNIEKGRLQKEVQGLEQENKKYLTMILKHSKAKADEAVDPESRTKSRERIPISEIEMRSIQQGNNQQPVQT